MVMMMVARIFALVAAGNPVDHVVGDLVECHARLIVCHALGAHRLDSGSTLRDLIFPDDDGKVSTARVGALHL